MSKKTKRKSLSDEQLISHLVRLETVTARRRFLTRHPSAVLPETVQRLAPLVVDKIRANPGDALRLAEGLVSSPRNFVQKKILLWPCARRATPSTPAVIIAPQSQVTIRPCGFTIP